MSVDGNSVLGFRLGTSKMKWYHFRRPRGTGSFFILLLNLLVFSYQQNALVNLVSITRTLTKEYPWVSGFLSVILVDWLPKLLYPFAGWLADAKLGRYTVMRWGLWIMWVAAVLLLSTSILKYVLNPDYLHPNNNVVLGTLPMMVIVYIVSAVGTGCFQVNLIPFGIDQMEDSSSEEISSFVHWYYWTRNINFGTIVQFAVSAPAYYCNLKGATQDYDLVISLVQTAFLTSAVCLDFLFSTKLNKDPKIHNPIKKVKDISKFILKHKQPVGYRSAYTYTYDTPPARSDFAKESYGGYFEDDDVEDVSAFWRMVVFLITIGFGAFLVLSGLFSYPFFFEHMNTNGLICSDEYIVTNTVNVMTYAISIPVFEFLIYPFFRKYIPRITVRIGLGMVVMLLGYCWLLATDVIAHGMTNTSNGYSSSNSCIFYNTGTDYVNFSPFSLVPVIVIVTVGEMLVFIATLEFICAQSPYSMRGLIIGILFFIYGIFAGLVALVMMAFGLGFKRHTRNLALSCGSSYILVVIGVGVVGLVLYLITAKWYKKRQRGGQSDVNHQTVVEGYYEKRLQLRIIAQT